MAAKRKTGAASVPTEGVVPLARVKLGLSRYVREVQMGRKSITITHHGRPAAILAPVATATRTMLTFREPVDPRPLGAIGLRPASGGASSEAIRRALDEERGE